MLPEEEDARRGGQRPRRVREATAFLLRAAVTLLLVGGLVWGMRHSGQWDLLMARVGKVRSGWLVVSGAVFGISLLLSAWQWRMLMAIQGLSLPFGRVFGFYMIGQFFSNFLPSSWGGDVVRAYDLGLHSREWEGGTASVVMDRVLGFYALFVVGAVTALTVYAGRLGTGMTVLLAAPVLLLPAGFYAVDITALAGRLQPSRRLPAVLRKFLGFWRGFFLSLGRYRDKGMAKVFVLALLTQCLRILMNLFVAWSLGLRLPLGFLFFAIPVVGIVTALPVSINGIGIRELTGNWLGAHFLDDAEAGSASAMTAFFALGYLVIVAVSLVGAFYFVAYRIERRRRR